MHDIIEHVTDAGAKVILVGDNEQLPPIEAGGAFRGIIEQTGYFELSTIQRQTGRWQKEATMNFSGDSGKVASALDTYMEKGRIICQPTMDAAKAGSSPNGRNTRSRTRINPPSSLPIPIRMCSSSTPRHGSI